MRKDALRRDPVLRILRDRLGAKIGLVKMSVEARTANADVAQLLGIDTLSPILFFSAATSDQTQRIIDVAHIYYRADRFKFIVDLEVE